MFIMRKISKERKDTSKMTIMSYLVGVQMKKKKKGANRIPIVKNNLRNIFNFLPSLDTQWALVDLVTAHFG